MYPHAFKYPSGVVLPVYFVSNPKRPTEYPEYQIIQNLLASADVVHLWNDIYSVVNKVIPVPKDKVRSCTFTGSVYRENHERINKYSIANNVKMVVQDPTFLFPDEIKAEFIPHAVNTDTPQHKSTTAREDIQLLKAFLQDDHPGWQTTMGVETAWEERMN